MDFGGRSILLLAPREATVIFRSRCKATASVRSPWRLRARLFGKPAGTTSRRGWEWLTFLVTAGWETVVRGGGGVFFDTGQQLGSYGYGAMGLQEL